MGENMLERKIHRCSVGLDGRAVSKTDEVGLVYGWTEMGKLLLSHRKRS